VTLVGAVEQDIVDSQGNTQVMRFDRPLEAPIFITIQISASVTGATSNAIRQAVFDYGTANSGIGQDTGWSRFFIPINTSAPGVNVTGLFIGRATNPTSQASVVINFNEIATY